MIRRLLLVGTVLSTFAVSASAETLREALVKAYKTNPTLTGQRASLRATDEAAVIARAAGLPNISGNGGYVENLVTSSNSFTSPNRQATGGTQLSVPLYLGGSVRNNVAGARTRIEAGRATLRSTETNTFTEVVGAYMDVIRDEAIVSLNQQNVRILDVNLQASKDRFQVGDLTRTDVAQSEARLALARAQFQQAQATLIGSRENYIRVVGDPPVDLVPPPPLPNLPASPDVAVERAIKDNPLLIAAAKRRDATRYDVQVAKATRLPQVTAVLGGNYYNYLGSLGGGTTNPRVGQTGVGLNGGLALNIPIFQGGAPSARVRQAEALRSQSIENVTAIERSVIAQARSAYAFYTSSNEVIGSSEIAVKANRLSLEGVRAENSVGTRTILEILNAEQELLNSQVTLVSARRDAYVAGFALLASMGDAEARDLGLDGGSLYDSSANYERVRGRIGDFGGDGEPDPVATSTARSPAQNAIVTKPLDPELGTPVDSKPSLTTGKDAPSR